MLIFVLQRFPSGEETRRFPTVGFAEAGVSRVE
jgi:hypothetical protein